jgi:hypothetical protein
MAASALRCSTLICRCFGGTFASVRSRTVTARLTALLVALVLLAPAAALAQQSPFGPIPPAPPEQTAPPEDESPSSSNDEDDGLSRRQQILITLAGVLLLGGIGYAIVRDARSAAPVEHHLREDEGGTRSRGTRTPKDRRVERGRARAKRARQARKKNR